MQHNTNLQNVTSKGRNNTLKRKAAEVNKTQQKRLLKEKKVGMKKWVK